MNLQSGTYYWPTTMDKAPTYPSLQEDVSCDVLIIGGGITGAECAYMLRDSGLHVVLVEKQRLGMGSTCANTAFIQYAGEKMGYQLVNSIGERYAIHHLQLCQQAIDQLEEASKGMSTDPAFIRRDSLYYADCPEDVPSLQREYALLKRHGFLLDYYTEEMIASRYPFRKAAAIYSYRDAELNPYRFTHGLVELAHKHGVQVFEQTEVTGKTYTNDHVIYRTNTKHLISAKQVILALGYENMRLRADKNTQLISTYAVATKPLDNAAFAHWHNRSLIWSTARPYVYMRTTRDNRIIIGGMDENTTYAARRDSLRHQKTKKLIKAFHELFPDIQVEAAYDIAAFYGGTHDGLPIIGVYDDFPRTYFLYPYGDNGAVYGMVLAKILRDTLVNGHSPDLDFYTQTRPLFTRQLVHS